MPIYEYACQACGHALEVIQKMGDAPLKDCPVCGKPQLKKLMSASGFQLKGSGWYATDFKGGTKKSDAAGGEAKNSDSDSSAGSTSKAESAAPAAAPAETKPPKARA